MERHKRRPFVGKPVKNLQRAHHRKARQMKTKDDGHIALIKATLSAVFLSI